MVCGSDDASKTSFFSKLKNPPKTLDAYREEVYSKYPMIPLIMENSDSIPRKDAILAYINMCDEHQALKAEKEMMEEATA
jgi:hypothetical protein